mmetsp:Transcript_30237/g.69532  ORF Transcript_30237/g.69532 Transcript_30237/m.69532 type:complete len:108 (-) Transcript_30237:391-714(-)
MKDWRISQRRSSTMPVRHLRCLSLCSLVKRRYVVVLNSCLGLHLHSVLSSRAVRHNSEGDQTVLHGHLADGAQCARTPGEELVGQLLSPRAWVLLHDSGSGQDVTIY